MLRAARHVHDLGGRKADFPAQAEQKIGVVGDRGFRLGFRLDLRVAHLVPESMARAVGRRWISMLKCECIIAPPARSSR